MQTHRPRNIPVISVSRSLLYPIKIKKDGVLRKRDKIFLVLALYPGPHQNLIRSFLAHQHHPFSILCKPGGKQTKQPTNAFG